MVKGHGEDSFFRPADTVSRDSSKFPRQALEVRVGDGVSTRGRVWERIQAGSGWPCFPLLLRGLRCVHSYTRAERAGRCPARASCRARHAQTRRSAPCTLPEEPGVSRRWDESVTRARVSSWLVSSTARACGAGVQLGYLAAENVFLLVHF